MSEETHEIENVVCKRETTAAILIETEDGKEKWVPKSVIDSSSDVKGMDDMGNLVVAHWWAAKEGLE